MPVLVRVPNYFKVLFRYSIISLASFSIGGPSRGNLVDNVDAPLDETLALLSTLTEKITNGSGLAFTILRAYRISINIEIPYHVVISTPDSTKLLRDVLEDDCMNKLEVVHDFCYVYKWSKEQVRCFLIFNEFYQTCFVFMINRYLIDFG